MIVFHCHYSPQPRPLTPRRLPSVRADSTPGRPSLAAAYPPPASTAEPTGQRGVITVTALASLPQCPLPALDLNTPPALGPTCAPLFFRCPRPSPPAVKPSGSDAIPVHVRLLVACALLAALLFRCDLFFRSPRPLCAPRYREHTLTHSHSKHLPVHIVLCQ